MKDVVISANSTLVESVPACESMSPIFACSYPGVSPTMFSGRGPGLSIWQEAADIEARKMAHSDLINTFFILLRSDLYVGKGCAGVWLAVVSIGFVAQS